MKKQLLFILIFASVVGNLRAQQCLSGGCTSFVKEYPTVNAPYTPPSSWQVLNNPATGNDALMNGGNYTRFNVTQGVTYEWTYCEAYGGLSTAWDAQLTLFNNTNLSTPICFSTDVCGTNGNAPYISWTATFTGVARILTTAYSGSGCLSNSGASNKLAYRQIASCTTPGTPASATGTSTGKTSANLSWTAGSPTGSATVTYYWVVGTSPSVTYGSGVDYGTTTGTSTSTSALTCNTTYYLRVYAYTSCNGTSSGYRTSSTFTTSACTTCTTPGTPASATGTSTGQTTANLSWTAGTAGSPTVTYYWVVGTSASVTYGSGVDYGTTTGTSTSTSALACNTTYYLRVYAQTSCDGTSSGYRTSSSFTTSTCAGSSIYGVDISSGNGTITWHNVYLTGKQFAFVKATEGYTYNDPNFTTNMTSSNPDNVVLGAYHFARPDNQNTFPAGADSEATHFLTRANSYIVSGHLPPALDMDAAPVESYLASHTHLQLAQWINEWATKIHTAINRWPVLYVDRCRANYIVPYYGGTIDSNIKLWIADYPETAGSPKSYSGCGQDWSTWPWIVHQYFAPKFAGNDATYGADPGMDQDFFNGDQTAFNNWVNPGTGGLANLTQQSANLTLGANSVTYNVTVVNNGTAASSLCEVGYWLSTSPTFATWDYKIGASNLPALNASGTYNLNPTISLCGLGVPDGTYYVGYFIDDQYGVPESNENDNGWYWGSSPITINCAPVQPDLTITAGTQSVSSSTVAAGSNVIAYASEDNMGTATAGANVVSLWLSQDAVLNSCSDTYLGSISMPSLSASSNSAILNSSINIPCGTSAGTYYLFFWADGCSSCSCSGVVTESNESNNYASVSLTVTSSTPNAPTSGGNQTVCQSALPASLCATPPNGSTIDWYNVASGGSILPSGTGTNCYSTSTVGNYYAESRNITTGCKSSSRTLVTLTVNPNVSAGTVSGTTPLCIGGSTTYSSTGTSGGSWSSTNTLVATVNSSTGAVTAVGTGATNITYTLSSGCGSPVSAFKTLTVNANVAAGTVSGTTPLCIGGTDNYSSNGTSGGSWSSTNTLVATVNSSTGAVTAVGTGATNITYTLSSGCGSPVSAFKTLTVNANVAAGTVSGTTPLCIGGSTTYSSNGTSGGSWSSTNTLVATVNSSTGAVTAVGAGATNITYTLSSGCGSPVSAFKTLTVNANVAAGTVSGTTPLCIGGSTTYSSNGTSGGSWSSTNTLVATVNSSTGAVTAVGTGATNITYTLSSGCGSPVSAFKTLTVNANVAAGTVSGTTPLCIGGTDNYSSNGTSGGSWSSTNTLVATVNSSTGAVTAVGAGATNITYTLSSGCGSPVSAFKTLTVNANVAAGTVSGTTPLCIGGSTTYSSNGTSGGSWSSTNTLVATVNSSTGAVTAVGAGTTDITYTLSSGCGSPVSANQTLTVDQNVSAGTVSGTTPLCINGSTTYSSNGTSGGSWSSTNALVATVNSSTGAVTVTGIGTSNITYTLSSGCGSPVSAFKTLTVELAVTPSVTITADHSGAIQAGIPVTFTALPVNGGTHPYYVWGNQVGDLLMGVDSAKYTSDSLKYGDNIVCVMTSNATCVFSGNPATSNTMTMDIVTGIDKIQNGKGLLIYPNPNSGIFTIETISENNENLLVKIFDDLGKLVYQHVGTIKGKFEIDMRDKAKGAYLLQVNEDGNVYSRKIIIQ